MTSPERYTPPLLNSGVDARMSPVMLSTITMTIYTFCIIEATSKHAAKGIRKFDDMCFPSIDLMLLD